MSRSALVAALLFVLWIRAWAQPAGAGAAASIQFGLERLRVTGGALMIAAHPDDENTALLGWLARGRKVRTAYLSLTRGEGGQNVIGPEQGPLLGVIRTQELLAARQIDGAEQFFTRAVDFGYSKSADEAIRIWDRDRVLGDIVLVIRTFQPDVIILRFSGTARDGHGQHQASAILGKEAFAAAADPNRFPEQLRSVRPWRARRLVWNVFAFTSEQRKESEAIKDKLTIDTGEYDVLLGKSYSEIAGISRSKHQSQAMGTRQHRGSRAEYLVHVAGEPASKDLFDGVTGPPVPASISKAAREFEWRRPEKIIPLLSKARNELKDERKRRDVDELLAACAGLWLDASFDRPVATPGESVRIRITALNRSKVPVAFKSISLEGTPGSAPATVDKVLQYNVPVEQEIAWTAVESDRDAVAHFGLTIDGVPVALSRRVLHRYVDDVRGELTRRFAVVPPVSVSFAAPSTLFSTPAARTVELDVRAFAGASGAARLDLPPGWRSDPAAANFTLPAAGDETIIRFRVTPPADASVAGAQAAVQVGAAEINASVDIIDYPHIPVQVIKRDAKATFTRTDVVSLARRIGYVMGAGDLVPDALRQLDCQVRLLSSDDLATSDLSAFDAIVTGVRAYNTRPDLRANRHRLNEYVRNGGTLIVQYNVIQGSDPFEIAPYPFTVGRDRVSVETAPVQFLSPDHPLLRSPNRITRADFDGWVQERGLYFASSWDKRFQAPLASADPGEKPHAGGLLYAPVGKGIYIFTAYSWFRQLPAGVPGAYRIFANLLSAGKTVANQ